MTLVAKDPRGRRRGYWDGVGGNVDSFGHAGIPVCHSGGNVKEETRVTELLIRKVL